jgi:hypothetical protein
VHSRLHCIFLFSALSLPVFATPRPEMSPDEQLLASLEQRAAAAPDREQCYLYAELVHELVKYTANQYASGEVEKATSTLKHTQGVTAKIQAILNSNAKKLKRAQILLRRAAFRLTDLLHVTSYEDRELVQETLAQVEQAERDTLKQVFRK